MTAPENPACQAFAAELGAELVFGQVLIRRTDAGFALRHVADRDAAAESLRLLAFEEKSTTSAAAPALAENKAASLVQGMASGQIRYSRGVFRFKTLEEADEWGPDGGAQPAAAA